MMKILVVEDERLLADSLQTLLTGRGFSVDTANDGLTGLEYAKTDVYDLVILDVMMPGLDGYTVCLLYTSDAADEPVRCISRWSPYH